MKRTPSIPLQPKHLASQQDRLLLEFLARTQQTEVKNIACAVIRESLRRPPRLAALCAWAKAPFDRHCAERLSDPDASKLRAILETQVLEALVLVDQPAFFVEDALDSIEAALEAIDQLVPSTHAEGATWQLQEAHRLLTLGQPAAAETLDPYSPLLVSLRVHQRARKEARRVRNPYVLAHLQGG